MVKKVRATIERYRMLGPGEKVMVALSGGADSVCLLHVLCELREELNISLCAAHLDHMLRGEEAERESEFARSAAEYLGLQCISGRADVRAHRLRNKKLSIQLAARELRYAFLKEKAEELCADKIALGHNANDQAETILMNILRGAGAGGLSGIPPVREGIYVRPLIELKRLNIEGYLEERGIEYVEDSSNFKRDYLRNRVRLELLPLLEREYNPRLVDRLAVMGDIVREESLAIDEQVESLLDGVSLLCRPGRTEVDIDSLMQIPLGYRRRVFRRLLQRMGAGPVAMDSSKLSSIDSLLDSRRSGSSYHLAGDLKASIEFDRLVVRRDGAADVSEISIMLNVPGLTCILERGARVVAEIDDEMPVALSAGSTAAAVMDFSLLRGNLVVRNRRPGDRFVPLGMTGSKKLKDYLIELRVPASERNLALVVSDDEGIVWVEGGRIAERVKVTPRTLRALKLRVENEG